MNYFIMTGTSRGLGQAIARKLIYEGNILFCISRNKNQELLEEAKKKNIDLYYYEYDLNDVEGIVKLVEEIFNHIDKSNLNSIYLVNNAGVVSPIRPIAKCESEEIVQNIKVNLISPMILVSEFIKNTTELSVQKRIVNISSGASNKPYYGWSCYCSAKSGLDLFTKCTGLEEESKAYPAQIISFAPGIMDTKMQKEIRESKKENFKQLDRFINFKEKGILLPPDEVAEVVLELLFSAEFEQGGVIDIKDILKK